MLLGEIHHRVKNNLQIVHSLLDLQSARSPIRRCRPCCATARTASRSMALIHQTLYQSKDFAKVDFGSFLDALRHRPCISSYARRRQNEIALARSRPTV